MSAAEPPGAWPSVSVVVPTHDRPDLLQGALDAIVGQDYPGDIECVVASDEAHRPTLAPDPADRRRVVTVLNERVAGPAGARNSAALAATGELLAFCDDDDRWVPEKLRLQVEAMRSTGLGVATCGIEVLAGSKRFVQLPPEGRITLEHLRRSRQAWLHTSTLVVRRDRYLDVVGPLDEQIPSSYGEDYDWSIRAARVEPIAAVRRPLVRVFWARRGFADRWAANVEGLRYLLAKHPDLGSNPRNLARMSGQIAFASAALHRRSDTLEWARKAFRANPLEPRTYLALLVGFAAVPPSAILRLLALAGKAI